MTCSVSREITNHPAMVVPTKFLVLLATSGERILGCATQ